MQLSAALKSNKQITFITYCHLYFYVLLKVAVVAIQLLSTLAVTKVQINAQAYKCAHLHTKEKKLSCL